MPPGTGPTAPNRYALPVIVVVGNPWVVVRDGVRRPGGATAIAALTAARGGVRVEIVGKVGDDDAGDALVLALAQAGVGHVALLRDPARATPIVVEAEFADAFDAEEEDDGASLAPAAPGLAPALDAADVDLGLRYLTSFRAVVVPEPAPAAVSAIAAEAARYAEAELIVVVAQGDEAALGRDVPAGAVVLAVPGPTDDAFAELLGDVAAEVDAGANASDALERVARRRGATRPEGA